MGLFKSKKVIKSKVECVDVENSKFTFEEISECLYNIISEKGRTQNKCDNFCRNIVQKLKYELKHDITSVYAPGDEYIETKLVLENILNGTFCNIIAYGDEEKGNCGKVAIAILERTKSTLYDGVNYSKELYKSMNAICKQHIENIFIEVGNEGEIDSKKQVIPKLFTVKYLNNECESWEIDHSYTRSSGDEYVIKTLEKTREIHLPKCNVSSTELNDIN